MSCSNKRALIVDDDRELCRMLTLLLQREGMAVQIANDGHTALSMIQKQPPNVVLADVKMPGMDGVTLLRKVLKQSDRLPVVMLTAYAEVTDAVAIMKAGAFDYLVKPFNHNELLRSLHLALQEAARKQDDTQRVCRKPVLATAANGDNTAFPPRAVLREKMGPSTACEQLITETLCVAETDFTVVLQGETGSGKSLLARALHEHSPRAHGPFIVLDCGAIPENLLETELFGYEKGAFTGAEKRKPGKFEVARGGTLFLDEITNLPPTSQMKLLCALQDKSISPVGGTQSVTVDARLLVACNRNLRTSVIAGEFREDLYYRLNEFNLHLPPLRQRSEDIFYLAERFREESNRELKKNVRGFSDSARHLMLSYSWPGNIRELRTAVRRAVLLADEVAFQEHFELGSARNGNPTFYSQPPPVSLEGLSFEGLSLKEIVRKNTESVERKVLAESLDYAKGNKAEVARILNVDYKTIHTKLKKYGLLNRGAS